MVEPRERVITGYCPHVSGTHSIKAVYNVTPRSGGLPPAERCADLHCKYKAFNICKVEKCPLEEIADSYNS